MLAVHGNGSGGTPDAGTQGFPYTEMLTGGGLDPGLLSAVGSGDGEANTVVDVIRLTHVTDVDGADFIQWQRGATASPLSPSELQLWQSTFGIIVPQGNGGLAAVPEPTAWMLALCGVFTWAARNVRSSASRP